MSLLKLPLEFTPSGFLKLNENNDDAVRDRLRIFVLAGGGGYMNLPSPGISRLWENIRVMGISSRLRSIVKDDDRRRLEEIIRQEANTWLEGIVTIEKVMLLGDQHTSNGISLNTPTLTLTFSIEYASSQNRKKNTIGCWNIRESWHAVH